MQSLGLDNLFFQKIRNNKATNYINAEDLDRQFANVSTYINTVLTPAINELTEGEIADDGGQNPLNKLLFNNIEGKVLWSKPAPALIPDGYISWNIFEPSPVGSILTANVDGAFAPFVPQEPNQIIITSDAGIIWGKLNNDYFNTGFRDDNKLNGDKFIRRTLTADHLRPGVLTPNVPDQIARTAKIVDGAVTGPKILAGSLELRNFGISASFPFQRLYNLMTPEHFSDAAITSNVIQDSCVDLNNFVNKRWNIANAASPEYLKFSNYSELVDPNYRGFLTPAEWQGVASNPNAYFFYYNMPYSFINGAPPYNPRFPVNYYWPRKRIHNFSRNGYDYGLFAAPESIPQDLTRFKYKFVTLGKLKNKSIKATHFTPPPNYENSPTPVSVRFKLFYATIKATNDSGPLKQTITPSSTLILTGGDQGNFNAFNNFKYAGEGPGSNVQDFYSYFAGYITNHPITPIEHTHWFGGQLLPNYGRYSDNSLIEDTNNPYGLIRLKNVHIKNGTVGKRHFTPSELARMKAAADAKFNG